MKKLHLLLLVVAVSLFSGCASTYPDYRGVPSEYHSQIWKYKFYTVDRGNMAPMFFGDSDLNKDYAYKIIDTKKEPFVPKPPSSVIERFEVRDGDCAAWQDCLKETGDGKGFRERSQLKEVYGRKDTHDGDEYWYTWSLYFPKDFKTIFPGEGGFGGFHEGKNMKVALKIVDRGDGLYVKSDHARNPYPTTNNTRYTKLVDDKDLRGKWHTIKLHAKWSRSDKGFFKVWINGKKKIDYTGRTTRGYGLAFKYGVYRSHLDRFYEDRKWKEQFKLPADVPMEAFRNIPQAIIPTQVVYYSNVRRSNDEAGLNLDW